MGTKTTFNYTEASETLGLLCFEVNWTGLLETTGGCTSVMSSFKTFTEDLLDLCCEYFSFIFCFARLGRFDTVTAFELISTLGFLCSKGEGLSAVASAYSEIGSSYTRLCSVDSLARIVTL